MSVQIQTKAAVTVAEMARMLGLSRARFYQLQSAGVFPSPVYLVSNRRPIYVEEMQEVCIEVRRRNFQGISVGKEERTFFATFLDSDDFSANSRRAFIQDARKLATWFSSANKERFVVGRVTTRDVSDFRDHLRKEQGQAVATVNRALVTVRRFFTWLADQGHVASNRLRR